ncbi:MAG: U32 family peptidase C-terminal domain-containing protein [Betaproteobacteria bacterium]|nr:U32 family peptidase C-terminal domain-containing protein [Betaproteobacteria bacterium]
MPAELLAPAGSLVMLSAALAFGADAVYAGQPRYSLRARNNEFGSITALAQGIEMTHAAGKSFYLVSNLLPHNAKLTTWRRDMEAAIALQPDALIMADPGLIDIARNAWPKMPIHLSVQANTMNWAAVKFWQKLGIARVILSRELSLEEIAEIRARCPEIELEVFVHGALCIAHSGRCLLSGYFNHRDANQGVCTNACRWEYRVAPAEEDAAGALAPVFIEEASRPDEWMQMEEDGHGSYILNSRDLRAIEHVARLIEIGVDSLKIEGRTKSAYYVARACQNYRIAIDDAYAGRPFDPALLVALENLAQRGYTGGFYQRHAKPDEYQNYSRGHSASSKSQYVGDAARFDAERNLMEIVVKNRFTLGDSLEIVHPQGNSIIMVERMENAAREPVEVAPGAGHHVWLPIPAENTGAFLARIF